MNGEYVRDTWSALLDADLNARYWRLMVLRFSRRDSVARIFLAATASATVASWALWAEHKLLWQALSAISALVSVALPIIDTPRKIETMVEAQSDWLTLLHGYEELWRARKSLADADFSAKLCALKKQEVEISKKTAKLPSDDSSLSNRCYSAVMQSRGLTA